MKLPQSINATVYITNATNFSVILTIYGHGGFIDIFSDTSFGTPLHQEVKRRQSFTIVQIQNSTELKKYRHNAVGHRQPGDKLIYFKSKNIKNTAKFAEDEFIFTGKSNQAITYVGFSFNVSKVPFFANELKLIRFSQCPVSNSSCISKQYIYSTK